MALGDSRFPRNVRSAIGEHQLEGAPSSLLPLDTPLLAVLGIIRVPRDLQSLL